MFDHEKLDVYQLELKFLTWVTQFLVNLASLSVTQTRELREQLDRASLSTLLNTAEGNGKRQGRQRARYFDDARGSAIECAACLDASVAKAFSSLEEIQPGKEMLLRVVSNAFQISGAIRSGAIPVRENASAVEQPFEDDDEHEDEDETRPRGS